MHPRTAPVQRTQERVALFVGCKNCSNVHLVASRLMAARQRRDDALETSEGRGRRQMQDAQTLRDAKTHGCASVPALIGEELGRAGAVRTRACQAVKKSSAQI